MEIHRENWSLDPLPDSPRASVTFSCLFCPIVGVSIVAACLFLRKIIRTRVYFVGVSILRVYFQNVRFACLFFWNTANTSRKIDACLFLPTSRVYFPCLFLEKRVYFYENRRACLFLMFLAVSIFLKCSKYQQQIATKIDAKIDANRTCLFF